MELFGYWKFMELDSDRGCGVSHPFSGFDMVHRACYGEEVPRLQAISDDGWEVLSKEADAIHTTQLRDAGQDEDSECRWAS